jgi:hypothetical protein
MRTYDWCFERPLSGLLVASGRSGSLKLDTADCITLWQGFDGFDGFSLIASPFE